MLNFPLYSFQCQDKMYTCYIYNYEKKCISLIVITIHECYIRICIKCRLQDILFFFKFQKNYCNVHIRRRKTKWFPQVSVCVCVFFTSMHVKHVHFHPYTQSYAKNVSCFKSSIYIFCERNEAHNILY